MSLNNKMKCITVVNNDAMYISNNWNAGTVFEDHKMFAFDSVQTANIVDRCLCSHEACIMHECCNVEHETNGRT